jgi:prophage regulatory protein
MQRILRRRDVETLTGLSRSTLYAMMADGNFPSPIKLGKRAVGWQDTDLTEWIASRPKKSHPIYQAELKTQTTPKDECHSESIKEC